MECLRNCRHFTTKLREAPKITKIESYEFPMKIALFALFKFFQKAILKL